MGLTSVETRHGTLQRILNSLYDAQAALVYLDTETAQRLNGAIMGAVVAVQEERAAAQQPAGDGARGGA
jgi:hypothetical protein